MSLVLDTWRSCLRLFLTFIEQRIYQLVKKVRKLDKSIIKIIFSCSSLYFIIQPLHFSCLFILEQWAAIISCVPSSVLSLPLIIISKPAKYSVRHLLLRKVLLMTEGKGKLIVSVSTHGNVMYLQEKDGIIETLVLMEKFSFIYENESSEILIID